METYDFTNMFAYNTVYLRTTQNLVGMQRDAVGTGFHFSIHHPEVDSWSYFIVTNRHVIDGVDSLEFVLNEKKSTGQRDSTQHEFVMTKTEIQKNLTLHPEGIDLCIIEITDILIELFDQGKNMYIMPFTEVNIPVKSHLPHFKALESVIMTGYPAGFWDHINNLPIMRKGNIASHLAFDYLGREEFVVDIAAYHGSSGSPLVLFDEGNAIERSGRAYSTNSLLLGIQRAIPLPQVEFPDKSMFTNLGLFIKSYKLLDFIPIVRRNNAAEIQSILESKNRDV
ncbi:serine protease [Exiguobacterium antarcticum]|uniref:Serine protease n=1 Tax=Exiguobacterium antarcticum TaxID=132920 RepID=A0ABT6R6F5_9BACL|nr:serine protease [Exiguobacterium antarcticum]MDI3236410.1 serine protease [Exiguobacterium antarcticum]